MGGHAAKSKNDASAAPASGGAAAYGGQMSPREYAMVVAALCAGTLIEWYDFTIFSQLGSTISAVFFPPGASQGVAQLGFFSTFAVGFLARPVGALIFGHIGDSHGRRPTLLISVFGITLPTILIGCLPTYAMAGIAAPLLLVLLRFLQGLSLGGEYGSAIIYLYEIAPPRHKGLMVGIGEGVSQFGVVIGIVVVLAVVAACSAQQMLVFGWRIPFLASIVTATFALVLRLHMPESSEFLAGREAATKRRVAAVAAGHLLSRRRTTLRRLQSGAAATTADVEAAADVPTAGAAPAGAAAAGVMMMSPQTSTRLLRDALRARSSKVIELEEPAPAPALACGGAASKKGAASAKDAAAAAVAAAAAADVPDGEVREAVAEARAKVKHHVPIMEIARHHLPRLLMHAALLAFCGGFYYLHFVFVPLVLVESGRSTDLRTLLVQILNMLAVLVGAPLAGALSDRGIHNVRAYAGIVFVLTAASVPIQLAVSTGPPQQSAVFEWVLQPLAFLLVGALCGLQNKIGAQLWPPEVRSTGYCFSFGCSLATAGGLTPLAAQALRIAMPRQDTSLAGGVWLCALGVVSLLACGAILRWAPEVDRRDATEFLLRRQGLLPPPPARPDDEEDDAMMKSGGGDGAARMRGKASVAAAV